MILDTWASKWNITPEALADLRKEFGLAPPAKPIGTSHNEADIQNLVRLEASAAGCRLWRNNVGAVMSEDGRFVRFGLLNESKRMNDAIKSADLIGIRPVFITRDHVGYTVGQFMAREVKRPSWTYRDTAREAAQLRFIKMVTALGGDACFATGKGTI